MDVDRLDEGHASDDAWRFRRDVELTLSGIGEMLVSKNERYGNSALDPVRIFSRAETAEQIKVRIDDKLSRLARGTGEETEDVELDLLGYLVLLRIARLRASKGGS